MTLTVVTCFGAIKLGRVAMVRTILIVAAFVAFTSVTVQEASAHHCWWGKHHHHHHCD
jgi:hypothetical protein